MRWFGHIEKMDERRMAKRVLMAEVGGVRVLGREIMVYGWCEGCLEQQKDDGGGCVMMRKI